MHLRGILALLVCTVVWGTTFPAMKDLSNVFSADWIAFLRYAFGGLLLLPFLWRARRVDIVSGAVLGIMLLVAFLCQVFALGEMSANRNAFITGLNVLVVPLLGVLLARRLPETRIVIAVLLSIAGLFAMCWDGDAASWTNADSLALTGAVVFGVYVKSMEGLTRRAHKLMAVTAMQIITVAAGSGLYILLSPQPVDWPHITNGIRDNAWNLLYLGAIATAAIIALQTWGQRHTSANEAAIVYAFEPATAAIAAWFWLGETMTTRSVIGGVLLIGGMIVSQWAASPARVVPATAESRG